MQEILLTGLRAYIGGKINGLNNFELEFQKGSELAQRKGAVAIFNPAIMPLGFEYEHYMLVCYSMIDCCDCIVLLPNWIDSSGAKREVHYALATNKRVYVIHNYECIFELHKEDLLIQNILK